MLCNNFGLIYSSKAEEIATESTENCRFLQPHCHLTPHFQRTPENIHTNLYQKLELLGYTFAGDSGGLRKRMYFETECIMAVQGHPRPWILAPIERTYGLY